MADITMPQLGETVTEGTITKWFKEVGDQVAEDEVLFEVSTDKVDSEVPSPASGYLAEILVPEGDTVEVGTKLAVVTDSPPGEGGGGGGAAESGGEAEAEPAPEPESGDGDGDGDGSKGGEQEPATTSSQARGAESTSAGDAEDTSAPAEQAPAREPASGDGGDGGGGGRSDAAGRLLSPVVRRLIAEHDLDPDRIEGTGAGGRITRNDVLKVVEGGGQQPAAREAPSEDKDRRAPAGGPSRPAATSPAPRAGERDEVIPFSNIRRRTAEHMVRSKATSAHALIAIEVDYENVDRVRLPAKESFREKEGVNLTYLPFISRAVIEAIREFPHVNSSVGDDELIVHRYVNLGYAVDLDFEGLVAPVVHDADTKRMPALAAAVADVAERARTKKLGPDDIQGGTFTITNIGSYGTLITAPVINQPQVAILSTDGVKRRPVVVDLPDGGEAIAVHPVGQLCLTWDHRAFDGAYAAAFMARVRELLETRDWSQEL
jgi:pyruvate dehydrogenase E2 component (dihydrolipoamide acetyltransferase)